MVINAQLRWLALSCAGLLLLGSYGCGSDDGDDDAGPDASTDAGSDASIDGGTDADVDAGPTCGDGICQAGEDAESCPDDCDDEAPECDSDDDCDDGSGCRDDGTCAQQCDLGTDCDGATECGGHPYCLDHFCDDAPPIPPPDGTPCTLDSDEAGVCEAGECVLSTCGDGELDEGEECDDGNTQSYDGCSATCVLETAYRVSGLEIADPHLHAPSLGCLDITGIVNGMLEAPITTIDDESGHYGLSLIFVFTPLDQGDGASGAAALATGDCAGDLDDPTCGSLSPMFTTTYTSQASGTCLGAVDGTTTPGWGPVNTVTGPCFAAGPTSVTLDFSGIQIPLASAEIAGEYDGSPATSLSNGLLRGFVSEAAAESVALPESVAVLVGAESLGPLLPGGVNADDSDRCLTESENNELDTHGGESGWWFYVNLPLANGATLQGPSP